MNGLTYRYLKRQRERRAFSAFGPLIVAPATGDMIMPAGAWLQAGTGQVVYRFGGELAPAALGTLSVLGPYGVPYRVRN
jgi:hypothetical protein